MSYINLLKKIKNLEVVLFFFFIFFFYYLVPFIIILFKKNQFFFSSQTYDYFTFNLIYFSKEFIFLITVNFLLFFFTFFFVLKNISQKIIQKKKSKIIYSNFIYKLILYVLCLFIIFDIINLFKYIYKFSQLNQNFIETYSFNEIFKLYRENIKEIIFQRRTHYKVLIILSVYFFRFNKNLSLFCYFIIIFSNILSFSRFEILQLFFLHILFNVKITELSKKVIFIFLFFLFIIIFYRFFLFLINTLDFKHILRHVLGDGNSVFLTNFTFLENLKDFSILFSNYAAELFFIYLKNNFIYILNDFFKLEIEYSAIVFFSHTKLENFTFAISPFLEILAYPLVFLFYIFILFCMKKYSFVKNELLFNLVILTILIFSLRGSLIHELGFLIKFLILVKIIELIGNVIVNNKYVKKSYKKIITQI